MIIVLLLFGAEKLPEVAKSLGKGMRDFKKATDDIRRELETSTMDIRNDPAFVHNTFLFLFTLVGNFFHLQADLLLIAKEIILLDIKFIIQFKNIWHSCRKIEPQDIFVGNILKVFDMWLF